MPLSFHEISTVSSLRAILAGEKRVQVGRGTNGKAGISEGPETDLLTREGCIVCVNRVPLFEGETGRGDTESKVWMQ